MAYLFRWKSAPALAQLEKENGALRMTIVQLRRELGNKQGALGRLRTLVHQRSTTIDDLRGRLEQSQAQVQRLDQECEHLAQLVRLAP